MNSERSNPKKRRRSKTKKRQFENIYSPIALSGNLRCKKVAFSPSFSCSAWLSSTSSSRKPPKEMSRRQIFAHRRCRVQLGRTGLQIYSWSWLAPKTMNKPPQESWISARAGLLGLLWRQATEEARPAELAVPPPSKEAWRHRAAKAKLLQRANRGRPQLLPTRSLLPNSSLLRRCPHGSSLLHPCLRPFLFLCHSPCHSPCLLCPWLCPIPCLLGS